MKIHKSPIILIFILFLVLMAPLAAEDTPPIYSITTFPLPDYTPLRRASKFAQTKHGELWIATYYGLLRFDGIKFRIYQEKIGNEPGLADGKLIDLVIDSQDRLWMTSVNSTLSCFNPKTDQFDNWIIPHNSFYVTKTSLSLDKRDTLLYLFDQSTIHTFDLKRNVFTNHLESFNHERQGIGDSSSIEQVLSENNSIWIITSGPDLYQYNIETNHFSRFTIPRELINPFAKPRNISFDNHQNIIITLDNSGIVLFNKNTFSFSRLFPKRLDECMDETYTNTIEDIFNNYWITIRNRGLVQYNPSGGYVTDVNLYQKESANKNTIINENAIYALLEDNQHNIWCGQEGQILLLSRNRTQSYQKYQAQQKKIGENGSPTYSPAEIFCLSKAMNKIFIGTAAGLYYFTNTSKQILPVLKVNTFLSKNFESQKIKQMYSVQDSLMWFIVRDGLFRYNIVTDSIDIKYILPKTSHFQFVEKYNVIIVFSLLKMITLSSEKEKILSVISDTLDFKVYPVSTLDKNLRAWIIVQQNSKYQLSFSDFPYDEIQPSNIDIPELSPGVKLFSDSKNRLWCYSKRGLININLGTKTYQTNKYEIDNKYSLPSNHISHVLESPDNVIWISTTDAGAVYLDEKTNRFISFNYKNGAISDLVNTIYFDSRSNIWLGSTDGITRYNKKSESIINYSGDQGLFFTASQKNAFLEIDSLIFLGARSFLFVIDNTNPAQLLNNSPVLISELKINNKSIQAGTLTNDGRSILRQPIEFTTDITLTHKDAMVTLQMTHLNYHNPESNQFAYYMDGLEDDWNLVGRQNIATYTFLPPGHYVFRAKAFNTHDLWSTQQAALNITVLPRFYQTMVFRILSVLMITSAIMFFFNLRTRAIRRRNKELETWNRQLNEEKAEREKAEAERVKLASAIEQSSDGVIVTDINGVIQYVNPAFINDSGYSREELIGSSTKILNSGKNDDRLYHEMWELITRGNVWNNKMINRRKNGEFYTVAESISPVRNELGSIVNYVAVMRDVTRQERMEQELSQVRKVQAIGTLAGGIAHDFNNLLSIIQLNADILAETLRENTEITEDLQEILIASKRGKALVDQILTFSRQGEDTIEEISLDLMVPNIVSGMLRQTIPSSIQIRMDVDSPAPIRANPTHIYQIMLNLATNARDAITGVGTITFSLKAFTLRNTESDRMLHPKLLPGKYYALSVSDTGRGIPDELLERIFDPFFTTKEVGKGTGMGLSILLGIMQKYNSTIEVRTKLMSGTTFVVYFPAVE